MRNGWLLLGMLAAVASVTFTFREAQASTCEWQIVNPPDPAPSYNGLGGLAAIAANDVWVSGVAATTPELQIQHFNGSTWTQVPTRALRFRPTPFGPSAGNKVRTATLPSSLTGTV